MDLSAITTSITGSIISIILLSAALGALTEALKKVFTTYFVKFTATKTYNDIVLMLIPYVLVILFFLFRNIIKQEFNFIHCILAANFADLSYRLIKKSLQIYMAQQTKAETESTPPTVV